ncbi:addiction module protein [Microbacterium sp. C7(2022)]|uniref:addiction module protein n=1 Tax=Microbacterium sp. C7(2022) TaxID=2992759 RepID=UPI00237BAB47|nr:addiction module protein [Microbacterium sp. C7(2022)]MDE0546337.1 addiction module protein [Microbacterium sp. C7(2022)]
MTPKLAEYIAAGKQLTVDERLEVAHELLMSVHGAGCDDASTEDEWVAEVQRRASDILSGDVAGVDGPASHARIRAELAARRR